MYLPMDRLAQNVGLGCSVSLSGLQRLDEPGLRTIDVGASQSVPNTGLGRRKRFCKLSECFNTFCV